MSDHASSSTATQVAQNSVFERFAPAGYVVSGLLHLTIGYLAIRIALGSGGGTADQSGAPPQWQTNQAALSRSGSPRSRS
jgi:uncharacterized protein DUF1206